MDGLRGWEIVTLVVNTDWGRGKAFPACGRVLGGEWWRWTAGSVLCVCVADPRCRAERKQWKSCNGRFIKFYNSGTRRPALSSINNVLTTVQSVKIRLIWNSFLNQQPTFLNSSHIWQRKFLKRPQIFCFKYFVLVIACYYLQCIWSFYLLVNWSRVAYRIINK